MIARHFGRGIPAFGLYQFCLIFVDSMDSEPGFASRFRSAESTRVVGVAQIVTGAVYRMSVLG